MSKKFFVSLCVCCLVLGAVTLVSAERPKPAEKLAVEGPDNSRTNHVGPAIRPLDEPIQTKAPKNRIPGIIAYDDGVVTGQAGISGNSFGNQFNTAVGSPVNAAGSVTGLRFFMAPGGTDNVFLSVFGAVSGTSASVLTSVSVPVSGSVTWTTHAFATPIAYPGSSFLAGVWYTPGDTIAVGTGTTGGQGLHGMWINDVAGTGFNAPGTFNAMMQASGDILVPVELMSFSVQ